MGSATSENRPLCLTLPYNNFSSNKRTMPAPLAVLASAGIMFTVIWVISKVFNLNPSREGNYWQGWVSGFVVGDDDD